MPRNNNVNLRYLQFRVQEISNELKSLANCDDLVAKRVNDEARKRDNKRAYSNAVRKAGRTFQDIYESLDAKAAIQFLKENKIIG